MDISTTDWTNVFIIFGISIVSTVIAIYCKPGIYLLYAQSFASGAFIALAMVHLVPTAYIECTTRFPYYSYVIVSIFALSVFFEIFARPKPKPQHIDFTDNSESAIKDFSALLVHNFSAITSFALFILFFIFLSIHSAIVGITVSISEKISYSIVTGTQKFVEVFTLGSLLRIDQVGKVKFWLIMGFYSLITPVAILLGCIYVCTKNRAIVSCLFGLSGGLFLFIGFLFWKKTFLSPFDWKRSEMIAVICFFAFGIVFSLCAALFEY